MKLNLCGPSYKHPSIDVNNQRCINMFPVSAGPNGRGASNPNNKEKWVLMSTAGLSLLVDLGTNPVRAMKTFYDSTYVVTGSSVYKLTVNSITKTATSSLIGTMTSSSGTVYMAANPTQIMIVDGTTKGYIYTPGSGVFQEITASDADFTGGGQVVFNHGYFIVNDPDTGLFYFSALNNGLSWDPLDVGTAESSTDNIVGMGISKGELWVIGEESTEIWYDAGNAAPGSPFSTRVGLEIQIGCGAADSIVEFNDLLIWLDNRGYIVQSAVSPFIRSNNSGYDLQIISDEAITSEILSYETRSDAIAMAYNDRGHLMYQITFPSAQKTWVYDYTTKAWHEREYFDDYVEDLRHHLGQFCCQSGTLTLMAGIRDGKVYLSSSDYLDDNGVLIRAKRVSPLFYDEEDFRLVAIDRLDLRMGIPNTIADDEQISLRYSIDGGHTWSQYLSRSICPNDRFGDPITWNRLGNGREWIFELTVASNVPWSIIDATVRPSELES